MTEAWTLTAPGRAHVASRFSFRQRESRCARGAVSETR